MLLDERLAGGRLRLVRRAAERMPEDLRDLPLPIVADFLLDACRESIRRAEHERVIQ